VRLPPDRQRVFHGQGHAAALVMTTIVGTSAGRRARLGAAVASIERSKQARLITLLMVVACACAVSASAWTSAPDWSDADSLFYQSMSLEVGGSSAQAAREAVFSSQLALPVLARDPQLATQTRQNFESQFPRRRWLVPALAAAIRPVAGARALLDASIVGYVLFGAALLLLLSSRFPLALAVGPVVLCLALAPTREWALRPMTDSWGLALMVCAIIAALMVLGKRRAWMLVWLVVMLALSFTRDLAIVPLAGLVWLMYREREPSGRRLALVLTATGALVTVPAYLLFGASLRLSIAFEEHGWKLPIPEHGSWGYVMSHYPHLLSSTVKSDAHYALLGHPLVGLTIGVGLLALFGVRANGEQLVVLMRGAALGWLVLFVLNPGQSGFRYELPLLPIAATGLCVFGQRLAQRFVGRRPALVPGAARP
jgi:hypothetical protein